MSASDAEIEVRALFSRLCSAWAAGDARQYAALFTPDSDYVAFDGTRLRGREENERSHAALFASVLQGTMLRGGVESVRWLAPDVAVVHALGSVVWPWHRGVPKGRLSRQTLVAVRTAEGWRFAAFHNTRVRPLPPPGPIVTRLFGVWVRVMRALSGTRGRAADSSQA